METKTQKPTIEESRLVERVASIVSSVRGSKPNYTVLAGELHPAIPFDILGIVLLRHDRQAVRVTSCQQIQEGVWQAEEHQLPLTESRLQHFLQPSRQSSLSEHSLELVIDKYPQGIDGPPSTCGDALSWHHHLRSTLIAPLLVGEGRVLGAFELGSTNLNAYDDPNLQRLISAVVRVLAAAIENAQAGGSVEIQNRQRQALKDVTDALATKMDLPAIFCQIVDGIARALQVMAMIITADPAGNYLRLEAQSGLDETILRRIFDEKIMLSERTITGATMLRRQLCISPDISMDERFPGSRIFSTALGIRTIFSYPLLTGNTIYGVLLVCSSEAGGFTPLKTDILSLFASQATIAIHNGKLLEAAQQRSRFQHLIEQLEQAAKTSQPEADTEIATLFSHVQREAEQTFGVSLSGLLHFISDNLLTRNERDIQLIFKSSSLQGAEASDELDIQRASVDLLTQYSETALKRASTLSSLSNFLRLYEQGPGDKKDAWLVVDLQGHCIYMNLAAEIFFGVRFETAIDRFFQDIFIPLYPRIRNLDEVEAYLRDFIQYNPGRHTRQEIRCILAVDPVERGITTPQAKRRERGTPLLLDGPSSDYYYQFTRYVLNAPQSGEQETIALRIADITEHVRDERNKSALLSTVSHDLRTPLTIIKGAVSGLLQEGALRDKNLIREFLGEIDKEADHLTILVNALVEMSRIEMGALILEREWCDIVEIVYGTQDRLKRLLRGRPIQLDFQQKLPLIFVDHVQIERVVYNLVDNAIRHSPEGSEIVIAVDMVDEEMLRVKIIDHGSGIPESESERIFHSFYGKSHQVNGLGLAICRGIVEAHRGSIAVVPANHEDGGSGSCFLFTLPVHFAQSASPSTADTPTLLTPKPSTQREEI